MQESFWDNKDPAWDDWTYEAVLASQLEHITAAHTCDDPTFSGRCDACQRRGGIAIVGECDYLNMLACVYAITVPRGAFRTAWTTETIKHVISFVTENRVRFFDDTALQMTFTRWTFPSPVPDEGNPRLIPQERRSDIAKFKGSLVKVLPDHMNDDDEIAVKDVIRRLVFLFFRAISRDVNFDDGGFRSSPLFSHEHYYAIKMVGLVFYDHVVKMRFYWLPLREARIQQTQ